MTKECKEWIELFETNLSSISEKAFQINNLEALSKLRMDSPEKSKILLLRAWKFPIKQADPVMQALMELSVLEGIILVAQRNFKHYPLLNELDPLLQEDINDTVLDSLPKFTISDQATQENKQVPTKEMKQKKFVHSSQAPEEPAGAVSAEKKERPSISPITELTQSSKSRGKPAGAVSAEKKDQTSISTITKLTQLIMRANILLTSTVGLLINELVTFQPVFEHFWDRSERIENRPNIRLKIEMPGLRLSAKNILECCSQCLSLYQFYTTIECRLKPSLTVQESKKTTNNPPAKKPEGKQE
ncbi:MAG: hypothetical protein AAGI90_04715 [Chlamydiota bacterium]